MATKMATAIRNCSETIAFSSAVLAPSINDPITLIPTKDNAVKIAICPRKRPNDSNLISNGVLGVYTSDRPDAMSPNLVDIPVLTTTPKPRPDETTVPINTIFVISCKMEFSEQGSISL